MSAMSPPTADSGRWMRKLARLGRFILFLCTAGWMYPHVCTEDLDLTQIQKDQMGPKP